MLTIFLKTIYHNVLRPHPQVLTIFWPSYNIFCCATPTGAKKFFNPVTADSVV
jgi:hypothetical protein